MLFLIYINDLYESLTENPELFADATSIFFVIKNIDASDIDLNNDLKPIIQWVFQQKKNFSPDLA